MIENDNELLAGIFDIAAQHPNANVSKYIQETHRHPTIRNVVMLLAEIAQNADYANNFALSLGYYLNLFETLEVDNSCILNEAGLLLEASSKIYNRRVDIVLELVHAQLKSLGKANNEDAQKEKEAEEETAAPAEKAKRKRKRLVEDVKEFFDVEMELRKFRKLDNAKRFVDQPLEQILLHSTRHNLDDTDFLHPATCLHSIMPDLDVEGELDTKRNFKIFTHHVEHRYNTLVPDINFRLHFLMKDFIDGEQERLTDDDEYTSNVLEQHWPPLSQAYVEKYVNLEDLVLRQERNFLYPGVDTSVDFNGEHFQGNSTKENFSLTQMDSGLDSFVDTTESDDSANDVPNDSTTQNITRMDSGLCSTLNSTENMSRELEERQLLHEFGKIKVNLPHLNISNTLLKDLDTKLLWKLSPRVILEKPRVAQKQVEVIPEVVEQSLKSQQPLLAPITLNILKLEEKLLRKKLLFKLGPDMDLYLKARTYKRPRPDDTASGIATPSLMRGSKEICLDTADSLPALALSYSNYVSNPETKDYDSDCEDFAGFDTTKVVNSSRDEHLLNRLSFIDKHNDSGNESDSEDFPGFDTPKIVNPGRDEHLLSRHSFLSSNETDTSAFEQNTCIEESDCFDSSDLNQDSGYASQATNDQSQNDTNDVEENIHNPPSNVDEALQRIQIGESCLKKTNIQEWHARLRPFLAHARERHHFDVFQIGTEIIDSLKTERTKSQDTMTADPYTFQDVMEEREESYVSRYFLSSLLLINQGNIELTVKNKSSEHPAEWSDLQFKLISTKRHRVSIEDNIGLHHKETSEIEPTQKQNKTATKRTKGPLNSTLREDVVQSDIEEMNISAFRMQRLSTEAQHSAYEHVTVNVDSIRPLSQMYKRQKSEEDHDSGVFSTSDRSTI